MGRPFRPGQSTVVDGNSVVTESPGGGEQPPSATPNPKPKDVIPTFPPKKTTKPSIDFVDDGENRLRPSTLLPIILPLVNNNWWWSNTPAPPFYTRGIRGRFRLDKKGREVYTPLIDRNQLTRRRETERIGLN